MALNRIWLLSGEPGSGKSTTLSKILYAVRVAGYSPGGVLTREIRSHGEREGFQLIDIATEESQVLANVKGVVGPRIGKYRVNLNSLSTLGVAALQRAKANADLVACDEVGPMELLSPEFRRAIRASIVESSKPSVCVVHKRYSDPLIDELRASKNAVELEVTYENREVLPAELGNDIIAVLSRGSPEHRQETTR
jgi:nucleoside-triphosphatase THEP1